MSSNNQIHMNTSTKSNSNSNTNNMSNATAFLQEMLGVSPVENGPSLSEIREFYKQMIIMTS